MNSRMRASGHAHCAGALDLLLGFERGAARVGAAILSYWPASSALQKEWHRLQECRRAGNRLLR